VEELTESGNEIMNNPLPYTAAAQQAPVQAQQPAEPEPIEESQPEQEPIEPQEAEAPEEPEIETAPQRSWKELRIKAERADQLERERDEAFRYAQAIEQEALRMQQYQRQPQEIPEPDYDYNTVGEEDLVDGKTLKKILASESKKRAQLEHNMRQNQQMSYETAISAQLKAEYADFDTVMTKENIAQLASLRPGLARSLAANPDLADKARETYQVLKDLGIYQSPSQRVAPPKQLQRNATKPRSSNSINPQSGETPLNQANMFAGGLTPELKAALYKEMKDKASRWN